MIILKKMFAYRKVTAIKDVYYEEASLYLVTTRWMAFNMVKIYFGAS